MRFCKYTHRVQDVHLKLNTKFSWQKEQPTSRRLFTSKLEVNLKEKTNPLAPDFFLILAHSV
jgi:hypothetical protein